jgi:hypothetical protein
MTDVGDSYFELQNCMKYLLFQFIHARRYLSKVCGTGHIPLSAVLSHIPRGTAINISVLKPNCDVTESTLENTISLDKIHPLMNFT